MLLRVAVCLLLLSTSVVASDLPVSDTMPVFWKFWSAAEGKPVAEQARLFREIVVAANPELYRRNVINLTVKPGEDERKAFDERFANWMEKANTLIPAMRTISERLRSDLNGYAASFRETFPDYKPATPIYFMVSLGAFDGGTRDVNGQAALLFGVDMLAYVHGADANLKVLFDHELFHQYHDQIWGTGKNTDDEPIWVALWREGLATYVSERMNPGATPKDIFMFPPDLAERAEPMRHLIAQELREHFNSTDEKVYGNYFFGRNSRPDLPPRSGYYVGHLIAKSVGAGKTLPDLALLSGKPLRKLVERELKTLSNPAWDKPPKPIVSPDPAFDSGQLPLDGATFAVFYVHVAADGAPIRIDLYRTSVPSFGEAALNAAKQWRFEPAMKDGKAIASVVKLEFQFTSLYPRRLR